MKIVQLPVETRSGTGSAAARRIRRDGGIPCILYGRGRDSVPLTTTRDAFAEVLKAHTALVKLTNEAVEQTALIRDVAWDTFGEFVEHLDLVRVNMDEEVAIRVPLRFTGTAKGVSDGGTVAEIYKDIEVLARVDAIPEDIECDISHLEIGDGVRVEELTLPPGVRTEMAEDEMIVQCTEPKLVIEEEPAEEEPVEGEEGAEGEAPAEGDDESAEKEES